MMLRSIAGFILALLSFGASAQAWPQRPVTIVVPFGAGGNTDMIARVVATQLSQSLGKPFIVDNRPGAAGLLAAKFVVNAPPDGHTLLMGTMSQIVTAPLINTNITFDPIKDFKPVMNLGANSFVISVKAQLPIKTLAELVAYAKQNPGKLTYGSAGTGAVTHLSAYLFTRRAGIDMLHVPYRGASAALADLLGGQIDMYSASPSEIIPQASSGKVRLLGISSPQRLKELPNVPTIAETYPGHEVTTWNGLLAPAGTSTETVNLIAAEVAKLQKDPAIVRKLEEAGITPSFAGPAAFEAQIRRELALWSPVLKNSGIKME